MVDIMITAVVHSTVEEAVATVVMSLKVQLLVFCGKISHSYP